MLTAHISTDRRADNLASVKIAWLVVGLAALVVIGALAAAYVHEPKLMAAVTAGAAVWVAGVCLSFHYDSDF